jgi:hypothetical protein
MQKTVHRCKRPLATKAPLYALLAMLGLWMGLTIPYADAKGPVDCRRLNEAVGGAGDNFRPPLSATVTGQGRAYFYTAPASQCMTKRTFIVPGDSVTVYKPFKDWYQIMYVSSKPGEDPFEGWIKADRLRLGDHLGGNQ